MRHGGLLREQRSRLGCISPTRVAASWKNLKPLVHGHQSNEENKEVHMFIVLFAILLLAWFGGLFGLPRVQCSDSPSAAVRGSLVDCPSLSAQDGAANTGAILLAPDWSTRRTRAGALQMA